MKSYTDIEQSKKLAKILPTYSSDMMYGYVAPYEHSDCKFDGGYDEIPYMKDFMSKNSNFSENEYDNELPCWSLAALLEVLEDTIYDDDGNEYRLHINKECMQYSLSYINEYEYDLSKDIELGMYDEFVDCCYDMIIKLHELNLI